MKMAELEFEKMEKAHRNEVVEMTNSHGEQK